MQAEVHIPHDTIYPNFENRMTLYYVYGLAITRKRILKRKNRNAPNQFVNLGRDGGGDLVWAEGTSLCHCFLSLPPSFAVDLKQLQCRHLIIVANGHMDICCYSFYFSTTRGIVSPEGKSPLSCWPLIGQCLTHSRDSVRVCWRREWMHFCFPVFLTCVLIAGKGIVAMFMKIELLRTWVVSAQYMTGLVTNATQ